MNLTLRVWRQAGPDEPGAFVEYDARDISEHASFLEMLDVLNEQLAERGEAEGLAVVALDRRLRQRAHAVCARHGCDWESGRGGERHVCNR